MMTESEWIVKVWYSNKEKLREEQVQKVKQNFPLTQDEKEREQQRKERWNYRSWKVICAVKKMRDRNSALLWIKNDLKASFCAAKGEISRWPKLNLIFDM